MYYYLFLLIVTIYNYIICIYTTFELYANISSEVIECSNVEWVTTMLALGHNIVTVLVMTANVDELAEAAVLAIDQKMVALILMVHDKCTVLVIGYAIAVTYSRLRDNAVVDATMFQLPKENLSKK